MALIFSRLNIYQHTVATGIGNLLNFFYRLNLNSYFFLVYFSSNIIMTGKSAQTTSKEKVVPDFNVFT